MTVSSCNETKKRTEQNDDTTLEEFGKTDSVNVFLVLETKQQKSKLRYIGRVWTDSVNVFLVLETKQQKASYIG